MMRAWKYTGLLFGLILCTSANKTMILTFSFDLYLAHVFPPNISDEKVYQELANILWEEAEYLASGRIHGFQFTYFSPSEWNVPGNFTIRPRAKIARANEQLRIEGIKQLSPSHYQAQIRYILTPEESTLYRQWQERSTLLNPTQGRAKYNSNILFFKEALEDSFYKAIQGYAQKHNLSEMKGQFMIKSHEPLLIRSGFTVQYSQIQLIIETPVPSRV